MLFRFEKSGLEFFHFIILMSVVAAIISRVIWRASG